MNAGVVLDMNWCGVGSIGALLMVAAVFYFWGVGRVAAWLAGAFAICAGIIGFAWLCSHFSSGVIVFCACAFVVVGAIVVALLPGGWGDVWK